MIRSTLSIATAAVLLGTPTLAQDVKSYKKAEMLYEHGLYREAKIQLIEILFDSKSEENKPDAYYLLGTIAAEEGQWPVAKKRWATLLKSFPESKAAKLAKKKTAELASIQPAFSRTMVKDPVARAYLRNGDFWSSGKEQLAHVEKDWIPRIETAVKWYDRVIKDFAKTPAAEAAHVAKIQTLLGWRGIPDKTEETKLKNSQFMDRATREFTALEKAFPKSISLQALRFQIGQEFWRIGKPVDAEKWLQRVVRAAGEGMELYRETAARWLKRMRY